MTTNGSKNSIRGTQTYIYVILATQLNKFPRVRKNPKHICNTVFSDFNNPFKKIMCKSYLEAPIRRSV